jgi:arginine:agmatine antiporter
MPPTTRANNRRATDHRPATGTPGLSGAPLRRGRRLGLIACTAVVVCNTIGPGFHLMPAQLAPHGRLAVLMWMVIAAGALCLGLTFARLARLVPVTGGPYVYAHVAYGDRAGFLVAWAYWIAIWSSLPGIAAAFSGSLVRAVPTIDGRWTEMTIAIGAIWLMVFINLRGVRLTGLFIVSAASATLLAFGALAVAGLFQPRPELPGTFNSGGEPLGTAIPALAPLAVASFLGLESATVPADDVRRPTWTIPRATVLGVLIVSLVYVAAATVMPAATPPGLVGSWMPLADAGWLPGESPGSAVAAIAAMMASLGALAGWMLLVGQVPEAAARHRLFPRMFVEVSRRGVPARAVVLSAALATVLLAAQASRVPALTGVVELVVTLGMGAAVIPYVFCAFARRRLMAPLTRGIRPTRITVVDGGAFAFALVMLYARAAEAAAFGLLLLAAGIPVYLWRRRGRAAATRPGEDLAYRGPTRHAAAGPPRS